MFFDQDDTVLYSQNDQDAFFVNMPRLEDFNAQSLTMKRVPDAASSTLKG